MATNYPTSKQTFTNPSAGDPTNSPSHAGLHADLADTVEAIQDVIGTGSGLTLSGTYVGQSSDEVRRIYAGEPVIAANAPDQSTVNKWGVWRFDDAANEGISVGLGPQHVPSHWTTFSVSIEWTNLGAGSGDVTWRADLGTVADGGSITAPSAGTAASITAPGQNVLKVSQLEGSLTRSDDAMLLVITRIGTDGGDNLTNQAGIASILLQKVT